jgi:hypothetical protein
MFHAFFYHGPLVGVKNQGEEAQENPGTVLLTIESDSVKGTVSPAMT